MKFSEGPLHSWWMRLSPVLSKLWVRVVVLVTAAFLVHVPSLSGQFIWDDNYLLGENPFFRSPIFSLEVFRHYLYLDSTSAHYRPVQNLSYMLDYLIWNGDVYGYHLSNVLWHAASGAFLFLLLRRVIPTFVPAATESRKVECGAFLVALVWALHPVHSAAVDYISGRADSLAFAFSCAAWLTYLRGARCQMRAASVACYTGAALLLLLGLCSREIACIWIAIFLLQMFVARSRQFLSHRLCVIAVCVLVLGLYAALRQLPGQRELEPLKAGWDSVTRAGLVLRALGDYTRLTVFPTALHMERSVADSRMYRPKPTWQDRFAFRGLTIAGLLAAAGLVAGVFKKGDGRTLRIIGAGWFIAAFLPISNVFELNATAAEHWLYLPLVGLLLVFFGWMVELRHSAFRSAAALMLCAAVALGVCSTSRSSDWVTEQVFYERTIAAGGWSPRVGLNLAMIYSRGNRLPEARQLLERTLQAWPDYPLARTHLAIVLAKQGAVEAADRTVTENAESAVRQQFTFPRTWTAAMHMAHREIGNGREEEALRVLAEARSRHPKAWPVAEMEVELLRRTRGPEAALPIAQQFAERNWWHYSAFLALGKLKAQQGDVAAALTALRHASRLDVRETEALNLTARIELNRGHLEAALGAQRRALSRQPDRPSQYLLFSEVLKQMGRIEQAEEALEQARSLQRTGTSA